MKIRTYLQVFWGCILIGLGCLCNPRTKSKAPKAFSPDLLEGTWYLNKEELYHRLYFQDSIHLALDSHIDMMFFYTYNLEGDTLCLYDDYGELVNHNIILKLDEDSLVFANLLDKVGIQRYSREKESNQSPM